MKPKKAYECDQYLFGGIVAFNRKVDKEAASELVKVFLEVIIAPDYNEDALEILKARKFKSYKCNTKPQIKLRF